MANVLLSTKAVGSTVKLKVNGTAKEFIVVCLLYTSPSPRDTR